MSLWALTVGVPQNSVGGKRSGDASLDGSLVHQARNVMAVVVGEDRRLRLPEYYPVTTRGSKSSESFEDRDAARRFGTEGSEVQILSPRPRFHQQNRRSIDGHRRLKAFFVGDSEITLRKSRKSLGNAPDCASAMTGRGRPFSVDFGGKVLP